MTLKVIGAGVGRTGTHSLKLALERLLGGPCHHMLEVFEHPEQIPVWIDGIEGRPVDWQELMDGYVAQVDWPGASFWPELLDANPDALVLLSVRDPASWYKSATDTIFTGFQHPDDQLNPWMASVKKLLRDRFSDRFGDEAEMTAALERHNEEVRRRVPPTQLLEWSPGDGWRPICEKLGVAVPDEPFPMSNTTDDFRAMMGLPPLA